MRRDLCILRPSAFWYIRISLACSAGSRNFEQLTLDGAQKLVLGTDGTSDLHDLLGTPQDIHRSNPGLQVERSTKIPIDLPPRVLGPAILGLVDVARDGSSMLVLNQVEREEALRLDCWDRGPPSPISDKNLRRCFFAGRRKVSSMQPLMEISIRWGPMADTPRLLYREDAPSASVYVATRDIQWSPDGKTIRFTRRRGMTYGKYPSDGTNLHEWLPGWNGSSKKVLWPLDTGWTILCVPGGPCTLTQGGNVLPLAQIWATDERHGRSSSAKFRDPFPLALGPLFWGTPVPSRDGKTIFARGVSLRGQLERYDREIKSPGAISWMASRPKCCDFSRDGKYVAYVSFPEGILWRANRDGSGPRATDQASVFIPGTLAGHLTVQ